MDRLTASAFNLLDRLTGKADPELIGRDELHFTALAQSLQDSIEELSDRMEVERRAPCGQGQQAMDRDLEIHRLTARLRVLRRFGRDLCLGRMVRTDTPEPVYVGRLGLTDRAGRSLLLDWRSPAAEPFFGATHANPLGLMSRRRYRWASGRISDYWDEVFTTEGLTGHAALDDQSAFIASLGADRSPRMQDVLGTIQADQDAIIRAGSRGTLVVDGGPGTGKTVVALHRTAYLLYADPGLGQRRGGVLFVGPHQPYLAYVADVLPNLGEEGELMRLVEGGGSRHADTVHPTNMQRGQRPRGESAPPARLFGGQVERERIAMTRWWHGPQMRTVGVDLSAEARGTAVAVIDWSGIQPRLLTVQVGVNDAAVLAALDAADRAAIDCPLGWPEPFIDFLVAHRSGRAPPRPDKRGSSGDARSPAAPPTCTSHRPWPESSRSQSVQIGSLRSR